MDWLVQISSFDKKEKRTLAFIPKACSIILSAVPKALKQKGKSLESQFLVKLSETNTI